MDIVRDGSGTQYLLMKRSAESSRVCELRTGEERYVPNDDLDLPTESPLSVAAETIPETTVRELSVGDERTLGLLRVIGASEPVGVVALLHEYDLCESDLHGLIGELRAAQLIESVDLDGPDTLTVPGDRGYRTTDRARDALDTA